ncbi:hypothetical protein M409DRAFT_58549 [Zasmidium cellare ATCC 36951]|uniref:Ecp2 effector protein domain-containing protein n=1 Tax=Zasmidium cellare ATCC 36951 TaxID=1080233 RepID=A0A6A6C5A5_ZASCE|nr:uncharacterized protein M409DRAFT_58549 [Zasmidium cellare ATCC 36951]KAF2162103.1 hypothetical protein M409DRAFT_58549 [Zasmidium cellare ATCC 36951]
MNPFLYKLVVGVVLAFKASSVQGAQQRDILATCTTDTGATTCGLGVGATASTIAFASNSASTWSQTFYATSLTEFAAATATTPTTITTTDTTGETVEAVIFTGGLAWLAVPKAGVPPVDPPQPPISGPPVTTKPDPTTTSTSSSSSTTDRGTQTAISNPVPKNMRSILDQIPVYYDDNDIECVSPSKDIPVIEQAKASQIIDDFCKDKSNQTAIPGTPIEQVISLGAGRNINVSVSAYPLCSDTFSSWTIDESDCKFFLGEALNGCQTNTLLKSGGTVKDACLDWTLQMEFNPGDLVCKGTALGTGVNRDEAFDAIHQFCGKYAGSISTPDISNTETYKEILGNSEMVLSLEYSSDKTCPQQGDEARYLIEGTSCERFLRRTIDDCNTDFTTTTGKYGGNITDACGVYTFSTQINEKTLCGGKHDIPAMKRDDAVAAINQFCDRDQTLDPSFNPGGHFYQTPPEGASWDTYVAVGYAIKMEAIFGDLGFQTGCAPGRKFGTKGDECRRKLMTVVEQCPLSDGGQLSDNTLNGCALWSIYGNKA